MSEIKKITIDQVIPRDVEVIKHAGVKSIHASNITTTLITDPKLPNLISLFGDPNTSPHFAHFDLPKRWLGAVFRKALTTIDADTTLAILDEVKAQESQKIVKFLDDVYEPLSRIIESVESSCICKQRG